MIGSNHFNLPQERLHCDYVTNILQKEIIQLIQSEQL